MNEGVSYLTMKRMTHSYVVAAALVILTSISAMGTERQGSSIGRFFNRDAGVDTSIPAEYRRTYSTSRNQVVMVFQRTFWRSLTNKAAKGSHAQQQAYCDLLTRSDLASGRIPYGFRYETPGDGRIYLLRESDYIESSNTVSMR